MSQNALRLLEQYAGPRETLPFPFPLLSLGYFAKANRKQTKEAGVWSSPGKAFIVY